MSIISSFAAWIVGEHGRSSAACVRDDTGATVAESRGCG